MKKILLVISFLLLTYRFSLIASPAYAACNPPDYSSCQEQNPDTNLDNRGYEPIQGDKNLIPYSHPIDNNAPQLSGLIEGNPTPGISNLYQVYDWNWSTNEKGSLIERKSNEPNDFATLVGLNTQGGQGILVPPSGYEIGGGYEVMVLYATPDSITLQYTLDDSVANAGYTIHLDNFQVDPSLLAYYNQLDQTGRGELPALVAGEQIGQAYGGEIRVAIRDTGSFLDPRWQGDWWQKLDPATAIKLGLKKIAVKKPGRTCQADQDFIPDIETKGASFEVTVQKCFFDTSSPSEKVSALLRIKDLDFPQNMTIASNLNESLKKLTPPGYKPQVNKRTRLGKISYDVCEKDTTNWFSVDKELEFLVPEWMEQMANEGKELAMMLVPGGGGGSVQGEQTAINQSFQAPLLAQSEAGSIPHGCKYYFSDNGIDCNCMATNSCRAEHSGAGCCPMHSHIWPVCGWDDCRPAERCSAGELQVACQGQVIGGGPPPPPTPKKCEIYNPKGDAVLPMRVACVAGECHIQDASITNPFKTIKELWDQFTAGLISQACDDISFIVTPKIQVPFSADADYYLRPQTFSIFKVPSSDAQKAFEFEHALENARHQSEASPVENYFSETEIYGQRGIKDSYDWVQDALLPPGY